MHDATGKASLTLFSSLVSWSVSHVVTETKEPSHDNGGVPSRILLLDHQTKRLSDYQTNFASKLGGPFGAVVSGRAFTNRLLSEW